MTNDRVFFYFETNNYGNGGISGRCYFDKYIPLHYDTYRCSNKSINLLLNEDYHITNIDRKVAKADTTDDEPLEAGTRQILVQ